MSARVPPHSLEAEMSVLGGVLLSPNQLDEISDLSVADFFLPAHQYVIEAMRSVVAKGSAVDVVLVGDELKAKEKLSALDGGIGYLVRLANEMPAVGNIRHYAQTVREKAMLRRLIATCSEIAAAAYGDCASVADFLAEARTRISGIELADQAGPTTIGQELAPAMESIENRAKQPDAYFLRTGLEPFDDLIGGLRGGNLITIAARPGQGKSAWALDILLHAAETLRVPALLFSYEMTKLEIVERSLAKRASINGRSIILGDLQPEQWEKIQATASKLNEIPLWLDTRPMRIERICSEARRWYAKQTRGEKKLAVVCVDYIGLVESTHAEENRALEISKMTRALKLLATELEIPVIAISQLNRESAKAQRKPMISDLRDSGAIEQDSNTVLFPYWEGMAPAAGRHPAQIIVGKNRGGPIGEVDVDWEPEFVRFSEPLRNYGPPPMRGETRFSDAE